MAEIEGQAVAEADHEEVLKELGLTDEDASLAESRAQAAELQEAADLIEQATKQLDDLQKQQAAADAGAGPGQSGSSKQDRRHHKQQRSSTSRTTGSSRGSTINSTKKMAQRALGSSGDAAFVAAAKALQGSNKPSRTLLLGCLEAIEQQQQQLRTQLAKQQVESAVAGAAKQQQAAAQDPAARKLQQLKADFERARERAAQEKSAVRSTAAAAVVEKLLPLLDSFEAAEATLDKQQQLMTDGGCEREFEEARRVYNALHAQLLSIIK
jgi:molecular chaperone GrpE (heat shock protein)